MCHHHPDASPVICITDVSAFRKLNQRRELSVGSFILVCRRCGSRHLGVLRLKDNVEGVIEAL